MEFSIDFRTIRAIVAEEYGRSRADIAARGIVAAYRETLERHDRRLAAAPDAGMLACKAGCSWCCYFSVDVRAVEVLNILDHIERHLSAEEQGLIRREIETNSSKLSVVPESERVQRNIKCPFLVADRCAIYHARPQTCRNYHATDVAGCKRSFEEPENLDIDPDFAPSTYQIGGAHVEVFAKAMQDEGYDTRAYELNTALAAALKNPKWVRERFEAKQRPFVELAGTEVPPEFIELEE